MYFHLSMSGFAYKNVLIDCIHSSKLQYAGGTQYICVPKSILNIILNKKKYSKVFKIQDVS